MKRGLLVASALILLPMAAPGPALASDLERKLESRWRGAWVITVVDTYSDCAGTHTDNNVSGTLVSSKGRFRFRPGELAQVGKIDVKRSRIDLLLGLPEPLLTSYQDGPFTLFNETRCLLELDVEMPRSLISGDNPDAVDAALQPLVRRFNNQDEAMQAKAWNRRKREAYPADYDRTVAEHSAWKAQQVNGAILARIDKAREETSRLADRVTSDPDYLKGFAAGLEAMRSVDLGQCNDLMSRDFANVAPAPPRLAGFGGDAAGRYTRGYQDGQRLVFGLESLRRLPQCLVPLPPTTQPPGPAQR